MEDRPQRVHRVHLGAQEIQRNLRSRHVGHHQVVHGPRLSQPAAGVHPHRHTEDGRPGELAPVLKQRGPDRRTVFLGDRIVLRDRPQPLACIRDLSLKAAEHAGNLVAARPIGAIVHRDRHHGHQAGLR